MNVPDNTEDKSDLMPFILYAPLVNQFIDTKNMPLRVYVMLFFFSVFALFYVLFYEVMLKHCTRLNDFDVVS